MRNRALLVGLLIIVAVVALVTTVVGLRYPRGPVIYADVHAAPGLREGAAVSFRGIVVGQVRHIAFVPEGLRLTIALSRRDVPLRGSDGVRVKPNGILGDIALELVPGAGSAPPVGEGAVLHEVAVDSATLVQRAVGAALLRRLARDVVGDSARDSSAGARGKP